jgi:hypothetical protein
MQLILHIILFYITQPPTDTAVNANPSNNIINGDDIPHPDPSSTTRSTGVGDGDGEIVNPVDAAECSCLTSINCAMIPGSSLTMKFANGVDAAHNDRPVE